MSMRHLYPLIVVVAFLALACGPSIKGIDTSALHNRCDEAEQGRQTLEAKGTEIPLSTQLLILGCYMDKHDWKAAAALPAIDDEDMKKTNGNGRWNKTESLLSYYVSVGYGDADPVKTLRDVAIIKNENFDDSDAEPPWPEIAWDYAQENPEWVRKVVRECIEVTATGVYYDGGGGYTSWGSVRKCLDPNRHKMNPSPRKKPWIWPDEIQAKLDAENELRDRARRGQVRRERIALEQAIVADPNLLSPVVKQPGANLWWYRCRIGEKWNGSKCAYDMRTHQDNIRTSWIVASTSCPNGARLPTADEYRVLFGGDCKPWKFDEEKCHGDNAPIHEMAGMTDNYFYEWTATEYEHNNQLASRYWRYHIAGVQDRVVLWDTGTEKKDIRCVRDTPPPG